MRDCRSSHYLKVLQHQDCVFTVHVFIVYGREDMKRAFVSLTTHWTCVLLCLKRKWGELCSRKRPHETESRGDEEARLVGSNSVRISD